MVIIDHANGYVTGIVGALAFLVEPIADLVDTIIKGIKNLLGIYDKIV